MCFEWEMLEARNDSVDSVGYHNLAQMLSLYLLSELAKRSSLVPSGSAARAMRARDRICPSSSKGRRALATPSLSIYHICIRTRRNYSSPRLVHGRRQGQPSASACGIMLGPVSCAELSARACLKPRLCHACFTPDASFLRGADLSSVAMLKWHACSTLHGRHGQRHLSPLSFRTCDSEKKPG